MAYVDGFVIPIPTKNLAAYKKLARVASKVWLDHGALSYYETVGDDLNIKGMVSFRKIASCKTGETVVFAWITYKSKAHRNAVNKKVMADPRIAAAMSKGDVPFDCKRMSYGGFKVVVQAGQP